MPAPLVVETNARRRRLIGQRFGQWVVIGCAGKRGKNLVWICRCDCGTERPVLGASLRTGVSTSCGHRLDLTGQAFGDLLVLARARDDNQHRGRWTCLCTCGQTTIVDGYSLRSGKSKSCGHTHRTDAPTYRSMHSRVVRERGTASEYACIDCGEPAQEWSYCLCDQDAWTETKWRNGKNGPVLVEVRYGRDIAMYDPRCRSCHVKFDLEKR